MRAELRSLQFDPEPKTLGSDPAEFVAQVRMLIGPVDSPGEESFGITVCTPEWLTGACARSGGIYDARHHLVVCLNSFNERAVRAWLTTRVQAAEANSWDGLAEKLSRLAYWEFEDYVETK